MRPTILACLCALYLAVAPASATATAASAEMFPSLRKRFAAKKKLAAAQKQAEKAEVDEPDSDSDEPVGPVAKGPAEPAEKDGKASAVQPPMDAGPEGYPVLPEVSTMLSGAAGTLKTVNAQASSLEARVVQAQMMSEAKMAKQKAAFDEKLKAQEQGNQRVIQANSNISTEIKNLKNSNVALRKHSKEIEKSNHNMRSELRTLEAHLGIAHDFTAKSLTSTDDSKNSLLQVLHSSPRQHRRALVETASRSRRKHDDDDDEEDNADESQDDKEDDEDEDDEATSFLALSSKAHRTDGTASFEAAMSELDAAVPSVSSLSVDTKSNQNPTDLLDVLSKDVAHLAQQTKESENNLKQIFIRDYRAGAKRHAALLAKQKTLVAERTSLLSLQDQLKKADAHLEDTQKQLEAKLRGLGQYLQKLAHFAMAPQQEVPHLLEVLPKTVSVKGDGKFV